MLIHLAATPDDDDFLERLLPNNLVGVYQVLEASRSAGVRTHGAGQQWTGGLVAAVHRSVAGDSRSGAQPAGLVRGHQAVPGGGRPGFRGAIWHLGHCRQTGLVSARPGPCGRARTDRLGAGRLLRARRTPAGSSRARSWRRPIFDSRLSTPTAARAADHLRPHARPPFARLRGT